MRFVLRSLLACLPAAAAASCSTGDLPTVGEPAAVWVKTATRGEAIDADGYVITAQLGSRSREFPVMVNDSVLITQQQAGPNERWLLRLNGVAANCWVTSLSAIQIPVNFEPITPIEFVVKCIEPNRIANFERATPHLPTSLTHHYGVLKERYVWREDGRFRLQYTSNRWGFFEYRGAFTRTQAGTLELRFADDFRWSGKATLRHDSLFVEYNDIMLHSDFEPGAYVKVAR